MISKDLEINAGAAARLPHDPDALDAQFLELDQRGARAAKRVEHRGAGAQARALCIISNQMWREREHEAIPVVRGPVFRT